MFHLYAFCLLCFYITVVREAEGHALPTPLLPEGYESGLRDLSDDGRQMLLVAAVVAWRGGLGVSICTITAINHGLTLKETRNALSFEELWTTR